MRLNHGSKVEERSTTRRSALEKNQRIPGKALRSHQTKEPTMSLFANVSERFARYQETRRTIRELSRLSDRDLHDLGITRASIPSLARTGRRG